MSRVSGSSNGQVSRASRGDGKSGEQFKLKSQSQADAKSGASGNTKADASGNSQKSASGNTQAAAPKNANTSSSGNGQTTGSGKAQPSGSGNSQATASGKAQTSASGNTPAAATKNVNTASSGNGQATGSGKAQPSGNGNSQAAASGKAQTSASGNTQATASANANTSSSGNARASASASAQASSSANTRTSSQTNAVSRNEARRNLGNGQQQNQMFNDFCPMPSNTASNTPNVATRRNSAVSSQTTSTDSQRPDSLNVSANAGASSSFNSGNGASFRPFNTNISANAQASASVKAGTGTALSPFNFNTASNARAFANSGNGNGFGNFGGNNGSGNAFGKGGHFQGNSGNTFVGQGGGYRPDAQNTAGQGDAVVPWRPSTPGAGGAGGHTTPSRPGQTGQDGKTPPPQTGGNSNGDGTTVSDPKAPPTSPPPIPIGSHSATDRAETTRPGGGAADPDKATTDAGQPFRRLLASNYSDGKSAPAGVDAPGARDVSNAVSATTGDKPNERGASDLFWVWGQFIDHDLDSTKSGTEKLPVDVPKGDATFDPDGKGGQELDFTRSDSTPGAGGRAQQVNTITALMDGSNVYGSTPEQTDKLRSHEGGKPRLDEDGNLPQEGGFYVAGDKRVNENPALTSMHTVFAREHNRVADELAAKNPDWSDQQIFDAARSQVTGQMQAITKNEFLPVLLGEDGVPQYDGATGEDAQISNSFATAAFRFGHSMVSDQMRIVDEDGKVTEVPLSQAFFNPSLVEEQGIDAILRGGASQSAQELDTEVVDSLRNFVMDGPHSPRLDLVALNIQRGRDHGLPSLNDAREQLGLDRLTGFDDPRLRDGVGDRLAETYDSIDDVDLWVGMLSERPVNGGLVGETQSIVLADQFSRTQNGDPDWYEGKFSPEQVNEMNNTTLSDVIARNTDVKDLQPNAMLVNQAGY